MADPIADYIRSLQSTPAAPTPSATPDVLKSAPEDYAHYQAQAGIAKMQQDGLTPSIHDAVSLYAKSLGDAQDAQRTTEVDAEKRTHLTPEDTSGLSAARRGWDVLDQIQQQFHDTTAKLGWAQGPVGGRFSGIMGAMGNPDVNAYNTLIHLARPVLNGAVTNESKTAIGEKANVQGFEANLPTLSDTPASAQAKLDTVRHMIASNVNAQVDSLNGVGRDLSNLQPMIQPVRDWDQAQQHPSQVGTPTAAGPILNGVSPDARALLSKAFPQAQSPAQAAPPQAQAAQTSPANQPVPAQPQQQQQSAADPNWFTKIFSGT